MDWDILGCRLRVFKTKRLCVTFVVLGVVGWDGCSVQDGGSLAVRRRRSSTWQARVRDSLHGDGSSAAVTYGGTRRPRIVTRRSEEARGCRLGSLVWGCRLWIDSWLWLIGVFVDGGLVGVMVEILDRIVMAAEYKVGGGCGELGGGLFGWMCFAACWDFCGFFFFFFFGFFCGLIFWFDSLWVVGGLSCRVGLLDVGIWVKAWGSKFGSDTKLMQDNNEK